MVFTWFLSLGLAHHPATPLGHSTPLGHPATPIGGHSTPIAGGSATPIGNSDHVCFTGVQLVIRSILKTFPYEIS